MDVYINMDVANIERDLVNIDEPDEVIMLYREKAKILYDLLANIKKRYHELSTAYLSLVIPNHNNTNSYVVTDKENLNPNDVSNKFKIKRIRDIVDVLVNIHDYIHKEFLKKFFTDFSTNFNKYKIIKNEMIDKYLNDTENNFLNLKKNLIENEKKKIIEYFETNAVPLIETAEEALKQYGGSRNKLNHADMNMKDIKELCKANQIKLSKKVNDKRVVYTKKELITKLKRKKLL
jgi:hypothetical protein